MNATDFHLTQLEPLIGGSIVGLARTGVDEDVGDEFFGLLVRLANGQRKVLMFLSDPEGNGPGSFELSDS